MLSIAADGAVARNAEAARVNQGGLECSSYTWQVGRFTYGVRNSPCQGDSGLTSPFQGRPGASRLFLNNALSDRVGVIVYPSTRDNEGETSE
jgi:hypothetical protein